MDYWKGPMAYYLMCSSDSVPQALAKMHTSMNT